MAERDPRSSSGDRAENSWGDERSVPLPRRRDRRATESRVVPAVATVERLGAAQRDDWTGEISRPWVLGQIEARGERATSPQVDDGLPPRLPRPRGRTELTLRLATAALLVALVVTFFAEAATLAVRVVGSGQHGPDWRSVPLAIDSEPSGAVVFIGSKERGQTPLATTEQCRGRVVRLRIKALGYTNWTWNGICPTRGTLKLQARLQALPGGSPPEQGRKR